MGNCCSDVADGRTAIGGTAGGLLKTADAPNDAVNKFLSCRFPLLACVIAMCSPRCIHGAAVNCPFGKLSVHAEECVGSKTTVEMILRCSDLEYRDLFSKSDPFLLVSKVVEGGTHIPVCKAEAVKNDHKSQPNMEASVLDWIFQSDGYTLHGKSFYDRVLQL